MMIVDDWSGWRSPLYLCQTQRGASHTDSVALLSCILRAGLCGGLRAALLAALLTGLLAARPVEADDSPAIAVASSLRSVWPTLASAWLTDLPDLTVRPSFGASNTLARQIALGAPFELFVAADDESIARLSDAVTDNQPPVAYATGRLALVERNPEGHTLTGTIPPDDTVTGSLDRLSARMTDEPSLRLALPNPDHAPYGRAAREVLEHTGLWPLPTHRLVRGENAAQTLQFLLSGAVDMALLPYALVVDGRADDLDVHLIDATLHGPLTHSLVILTGASADTRKLADWLQSSRAQDIFAAAGFDEPP